MSPSLYPCSTASRGCHCTSSASFAPSGFCFSRGGSSYSLIWLRLRRGRARRHHIVFAGNGYPSPGRPSMAPPLKRLCRSTLVSRIARDFLSLTCWYNSVRIVSEAAPSRCPCCYSLCQLCTSWSGDQQKTAFIRFLLSKHQILCT